MHREFVDLYNRELALFYEHAEEFAQEYPGIADRLGGMTRDRSDPMFSALLQGAAFLAARVQLKIRHEFPEFTNNLIEQLLPGFLAPAPSAMLARVEPVFGDPALREGRTIRRGAFLDAIYRERDQNVSCRYTLCSDLTIWPFELTRAEYLASPGPLHALGLEGDFRAGLRLTLRLRATPRVEDEVSEEASREDPTGLFAGCPVSALPIHLVGAEGDASMLYEQIFGRRTGIHLRHLDPFGDAKFTDMGATRIEQVGFGDDETLLPYDPRLFRGFSLLQEYFMFPRKFLGFRVATTRRELFPVPAREIDLILTFSEPSPRLAAAVDAGMFALYAAPAVNLFPKTADRVPVASSRHEHQIVPDRSHPLDFEPHTVLDVYAHYAGHSRRERLAPLYAPPSDLESPRLPLHYTIRRLARRRTSTERRFGSPSDYVGTEMFISLGQSGSDSGQDRIQELSVRALCSNRHLADQLPVGKGGADFTFAEDTSLVVVCAGGPPTRPREPLLHRRSGSGPTAWRLINMLSLNHLGLSRADGQALRETLALFADPGDTVIERRIRSLRSVSTRPVVRRVKDRFGVGAARGIEVTVSFEEKSFEGGGVFLLGAVLEHFLAEYAALNHFTQTVVTTAERGEIARWPARAGSRRPL
jgi:type VI secretion system protein ImpG